MKAGTPRSTRHPGTSPTIVGTSSLDKGAEMTHRRKRSTSRKCGQIPHFCTTVDIACASAAALGAGSIVDNNLTSIIMAVRHLWRIMGLGPASAGPFRVPWRGPMRQVGRSGVPEAVNKAERDARTHLAGGSKPAGKFQRIRLAWTVSHKQSHVLFQRDGIDRQPSGGILYQAHGIPPIGPPVGAHDRPVVTNPARHVE